VAHPVYQEETPAWHRAGQRPARGRPDERILVSAYREDRLNAQLDLIFP
jgi:hypothetical protein